MSVSAPDNLSPLTTPPASVRSVDAGAYELGVQSAWTRNDAVVTSIEQSESMCTEPPSSGPTNQSGSDRIATDPIEEALDAPVEPSTPLVSEDGNRLKNSPEAGDRLGSAEMSLSPPIVSIAEREHLVNDYPRMGLFDSLRISDAHPHGRSETVNWAEFPDDNEIGDVPEFSLNAKLEEEQPTPLPRDKSADKTRYQHASSILPTGSSIKRAMTGSGLQHPEPSDSDSLDDEDHSSTESDNEHAPRKKLKKRTDPPECRESSPFACQSRNETRREWTHPLNDFGADFLTLEPESDHDMKQITHWEYWAKLNLLKYQQSFIKNDPPFTYNGEANATTFKKWVREVRDWKDQARLTTNQSLHMLGKYLGGQAYRFFERDVLDLQKDYSMTEFFEQLFDYVFPPDFRMQQRQRFLECKQDHKHTVHDYLRRLRDLADIAGDLRPASLATNTTLIDAMDMSSVLKELTDETVPHRYQQTRYTPQMEDRDLVTDHHEGHPKPGHQTSSIQARAVGISDAAICHAAIKEGVANGLYGMAVSLSESTDPSTDNHLPTVEKALALLRRGVPLLTDEIHNPLYNPYAIDRFTLENWGGSETYLLLDKHNYDSYIVYYAQISDPDFDAVAWLTDLKLKNYNDLIIKGSTFKLTWKGQVVEKTHTGSGECNPGAALARPMNACNIEKSGTELVVYDECPDLLTCESTSEDEDPDHDWDEPSVPNCLEDAVRENESVDHIYCGGSRPELLDVRSLHRNAVRPKSSSRILPRALVVVIHINDRPCRALLDSGSLTDFLFNNRSRPA
ncbi:hypothetical protein F4604DRAFT_1690746 [Suillus subluteus]|nr:hypothetical protein F4604DRAFT_1690746 [Suillus subluteus]